MASVMAKTGEKREKKQGGSTRGPGDAWPMGTPKGSSLPPVLDPRSPQG